MISYLVEREYKHWDTILIMDTISHVYCFIMVSKIPNQRNLGTILFYNGCVPIS